MRPTITLLMFCLVAGADEPAPPAKAAAPEFPRGARVGGHAGLAISIANFDNDGATAIGRDYVQVGVTPGITVKLDDHWAIDFEFIAFSRWDLKPADKSHTIFVADPGVVYNFGPAAAGLRLAVQVGEGVPLNFGLVPIVVVPFKISTKLSYFLELDLPVFVTAFAATATSGSRVVGSLTLLLQTGFAF
jgi:hypothetical protein